MKKIINNKLCDTARAKIIIRKNDLKSNKKIPLICRIKRNHLFYTPSPSALFVCKYGIKNRPTNLCLNCPKYIDFSLHWQLSKK